MTSARFPRRFTGKVVLITGAARGIGQAIALRVAAEGGQIVMADRDQDELRRTTERSEFTEVATTVAVDLADMDATRDLADVALDRFGRLDGIVCNAGTGWHAAIEEHPFERWRQVLDVNLRSPAILLDALFPALRRSRGSAVLIASIARHGVGRQVAYDSSKGGLVGLTRALARRGSADGVRVNAVCPGFIDTRLVRAPGIREATDAIVSGQPLARLGRPEEVASATTFLLSEDAASMTGQALYVDGGLVR